MRRKIFAVLQILVILITKSTCCNEPTPASAPAPALAPTNDLAPANRPNSANGPAPTAIIPADKYPTPRRDESVEDTYPGCTKIKDPYRWMENLNSTETKEFIKQENDLSKDYLGKSPFRTELLARYKELRDYPSVWGPFQVGKYFFTFRNTGSQTQYVIYKSNSVNDVGTVFFDLNTLSNDDSLIMDYYAFTNDGEIFAYLVTNSESDGTASEVSFKNTGNGEVLNEKLVNVTSSSISWSLDKKGIFYIVTAGKGKDPEDPSDDPQKLYYHFMGTTQCKDIVVAEFPDHPEYSM
ncbi:prolyl endopeptidase-like [Planococcus citri]|uniref:prolyl endopeptidase-like n=1 Tax=Planococcus citri TaxID=170843 RepID=UPI0031F9FAC1